MVSELTLKDHVAVILKIKQAEPDTSIFDIVMEYDNETDDFDITEFLRMVKKNKSFQAYVKNDLLKFNYGKYYVGGESPDEETEVDFLQKLF